MFRGGPAPIHPLLRPDIEGADAFKCSGDPAKDEQAADKDWRALVLCGGAGDRPDSAEEQARRYGAEDSLEFAPGFGAHLLRKGPDLIAAAGLDYTVRTFDVKNRFRQVQLFEGHAAPVTCLDTYRGRWLISGSDDMTVRLWRLGGAASSGPELTIWLVDKGVKSICALPGHRAACGVQDETVRILSLATGATLHIMDHQAMRPEDSIMREEGCGSALCLLHLRGNVLCSGSEDAAIRFWDVDTAECLGMRLGHKGYGDDIGSDYRKFRFCAEYAPVLHLCHLGGDGTMIASCSYDRTVCIWDTSDLCSVTLFRRLLAGENSIMSVCAVDETRLLTCGADKEVKIWNWQTGDVEVKTHTRGIACDAALLDGRTVALGGGDATIRVFDWQDELDLRGEGICVMEASIKVLRRVFLADGDDSLWVKKPIMYQTVDRSVVEADSRKAIDLQVFLLNKALSFRLKPK